MKKYTILSASKAFLLLLCTVYAAIRKEWVAVAILAAAAGLDIYISINGSRIYRLFLLLQDEQQSKGEEENTDRSQLLFNQMQLNVLQNQINPHFLYNTLECIRSEALVNGQKGIARMAEHLSKYFRYCISNREIIVSLNEEIKNIQDYYAIQRFRFGEKVSMNIQVLRDEYYDCYLPKLTLQPLVENAIIHGIENSEGDGLIEIIVDGSDNSLFITVRDNGNGMPPEQLEKLNRDLAENNQSEKRESPHSGIAARNVNMRIRICFGKQYGLHYRSIYHQSTEVEIYIPRVDILHREELMENLKEVR